MANDHEVFERIKALVEEEHELNRSGGADRHDRRVQIEQQLDQCWDLLRQREARRQAGDDPGLAHARPVEEVEGYLQ
jgi:phosphoglycerate-specific signal transduction histidine kinase